MASHSFISFGRPVTAKAILSRDQINHRSQGSPISTRCQGSAAPMLGNDDGVKPLVVVGSINADLVIEVPRLPKPGETLSGGTMNVYPGGKVSFNIILCNPFPPLNTKKSEE